MRQKNFKKIFQRCFALLMTFILVFGLAGCSSGNNGIENPSTETGKVNYFRDNTETDNSVTSKGRYVETQLATPDGFEGYGSLVRMSDGSLAIFDYKNGVKHISSDEGLSWSRENVEGIYNIAQNNDDVDGTIAPDGSIFFSYVMWHESTDEKLFPEKYVYITADGTKQEFELGLEDYKNLITKEVFSPDGRLFALSDYKIYEIDVQNQTYKLLFELENLDNFMMYAGSTQLMVYDGHVVYFYNYDSGELSMEDAVLNSFVEEQGGSANAGRGIALCNATGDKADSSLYLASAGGIYHHIIGGSVMEQLADGSLNTLGDPTRKPINILPSSEDTILILYQTGELYSYKYDPNASTIPEEQISIYSLYDNETVRRAISVFRKNHSDVFVKFEIGLTGESGMTENDAIRNLNTRLLSGEGPDLLLLDGMPMDSYVEKGILADLSSEVENWKTQNTFFEGIFESYRQKEGLFVIPFRFEIPIIAGMETDINSIGDLNSLAQAAEQIADSKQEKPTVLGTYNAEELLEKLYPLCTNAWISEDNNIDKNALREFLTSAKSIYTAEQKNLGAEEIKRHENYLNYISGHYSEDEKKKHMLGTDNQTTDQLMGWQTLIAGYLYSMEDYRAVTSIQKKYKSEQKNYQFSLWNGQGSNIFVPTGIVGLCTNAKNPETAKAFLVTLLDKEVQKVDLQDGFPVNQNAYGEFTANLNAVDYSLGISTQDGEYVSLEIVWPNEEDIKLLQNMINTLNTPAKIDNQMKEAVILAGVKALTGEKDIEESVEEIAQKISLQLQE